MSAIDDAHAGRNLIDVIDENGAFLGKLIHNEAIVDNFLAHIDRGSERLKGNFYHIDSAHHSCAEAAGLEHEDAFFGFGDLRLRDGGNGVDSRRGHPYSISWREARRKESITCGVIGLSLAVGR